MLVGFVEKEEVGHVWVEWVINDATGRLAVRRVHDGHPQPHVGEYVRVYGRVTTSLPPFLRARGAWRLSHWDEISYHTVEAAYAHLHRRRVAAEESAAAEG